MHGKVVGVTDYGAFVQIEPGVEGLVHVSEMSWSKHVKHPSKIVKVGDEVDVVVLEVKTDQRRISLGLKQTQPDPWEAAAQKYPVGTLVNGRIRNLADFGAFVELEEGMEGLIHISDVSWTERIKHPSEKFKKGETVEAQGPESGFAESPAVAGHQAVERYLGELVRGAQDRRRAQGKSRAHHGFRRVCGAGRRHRGPLPRFRNRRAAAEGRPRKDKAEASRADARVTAVLVDGQGI